MQWLEDDERERKESAAAWMGLVFSVACLDWLIGEGTRLYIQGDFSHLQIDFKKGHNWGM